MLRSMFSAISGLRAHQTKMDVTGNNIANVNTVGFKGSQTVFQDTLSQVIRAGGAPAADRGGTNPAQVGLGVKVAAITTNWTQGATQSTGRSTDFMIEGDGFFVTRGTGGEQLYTRAGSFDFDGAGKLVTPDGSVLQGWMADADGVVNPNGPIGDLSVPYGQLVDPAAHHRRRRRRQPARRTPPIGASCRPASRCTTARASSRRSSTTSPRPPANTWDLDVDARRRRPPWSAATAVAFDAAGALTDPAGAGSTSTPFTPPGGRRTRAGTNTGHDRHLAADPVRRREHPRRARAGRLRARARCSRSSSAPTARSWASTPTSCASRWAGSPWPPSTTRAVWRRPATARSGSA